MVIGIWSGESKPPLAEYLHPLIDELKTILLNGVHLNSQRIEIHIGNIICDTPARAFIKGLMLIIKIHITNVFCVHMCTYSYQI